MANSDKNILITPNIGQAADPKIVFTGADASTGPQSITLQVYPTNNGTLSFEGTAGQLFSITNSMAGTIYSVNDVSGIPSIEVLDTGLVKLAQYSGNVLIGTGTDNGTDKLQINGSISGTTIKGSTLTSTVATGTAPLSVSSTTVVNNLNADLWDGYQFASYLNQAVRTDSGPTFAEVYNNGWFRSNTNNTGLYNSNTTQHWSSNTNGYWDASSTTTVSGIRFYTGSHMSALRGYVYANDSNEIGFLDQNGAWTLRMSGGVAYATTFSGNLSGNASTATSADQIDGVAFRNTGSNAGIDASTLDSNGITYYTAGVDNFSGNATDGALYSQAYSNAWQHQIAGDYRSGQIALRGKNSGTWQAWRTVLDSSNYNTYAPTKTGTGASGTWGISITGSAAILTTARTLTIGSTGKTFNGSADVNWSLSEIGAQPTLVSGTNIKTVNGTTLLGSGDIAIAASSPTLTIDNKTAAYTVVAGDLGKIINCTSGTFTVSLTAAATLGAGFNCWIWNTSSTIADTITIDPNASETIDGVATILLRRGEGVQIVCDGTNWQTGDKKAMRGYAENMAPTAARPVASKISSIAIGQNASSAGDDSIAIGSNTVAGSGANESHTAIGSWAHAAASRSTAIGGTYTYADRVYAAATLSFAAGFNSAGKGAQTVTGSGAMALGGSYASGTNSFAAAIANNTSSYGATEANSVAIGYNAKCAGNVGLALGYLTNVSGSYSVGIGYGATASAPYCIAISADFSSTASATGAVALGTNALANTVGKYAYSGSYFYGAGTAQTGTFVLSKSTTDATATVLSTNTSAAGSTNQVILSNNSTYTFRVQVVAMQKASDGTNTAGYTFEGVIRRGANAAATVLKNSTKTVLHEDVAGWDCNISADTTNGGLAVTVTGAAATNIRWVATVTTTEVTYA